MLLCVSRCTYFFLTCASNSTNVGRSVENNICHPNSMQVDGL